MADKTGIQWTDATWNPIAGCSLVSPGCTNCYAMKMAARIEAMSGIRDTHYAGTTMPTKAGPVWTGKVNVAPDHILTQPLRWKRPRRIFVNSMSDLFHDAVDDATIDKVFAVMALCQQHTFQVLTKRADRMKAYMLERWQGTPAFELDGVHFLAGPETGRHYQVHMAAEELVDDLGLADTRNDSLWDEKDSLKIMKWSWPLPNVWLGVSVEDQARANERIPDLLATPAAVRWISAEPLLGPVDIRQYMSEPWEAVTSSFQGSDGLVRSDITGNVIAGLDWVVAGGESGPGARPMHPDWARSLRDQCADAEVPFFFKQWGSWAPVDHSDAADAKLWEGKPGVRKLRRDGSHIGPDGKWPDEATGEVYVYQTGKKAAGDLLDGVRHHAWPRSEPTP